MNQDAAAGPQILHASCIVFNGAGVLIIGPSGSGKSALALKLMALGAHLVADDRTIVSNVLGRVTATCPATLSGLIEARGIGILPVHAVAPSAVVQLVIDLGCIQTQRMPAARTTLIAGVHLETFTQIAADHFPAAVLCYLNGLNPASRWV